MTENKKVTPFFLIFFAVYPLLFLLAENVYEVPLTVALRPGLLSLIAMGILVWVSILLVKDRERAFLLATIYFLVMFTYGHIDLFLETSLSAFTVIAKIIPFFLLIILVLLCFFMTRWVHRLDSLKFQTIFQSINLVSVFLLIYPGITIGQFWGNIHFRPENTVQSVQAQADTSYPDIYYIILDGYSRGDTLEFMGYDNSPFLMDLENQGFYVAQCSTSNYKWTLLSLASTFNMHYLWKVFPDVEPRDTNLLPLFRALHDNRVVKDLRERGYKIVAFDTGYEWLNWKGADQYIELERLSSPFFAPLQPFEYLFLKTTLFDLALKGDFLRQERYQAHYQRIHYNLDKLNELAIEPGPKFVYAHLVVPHTPYIFNPDGTFKTKESDNYSDKNSQYANYLDNVEFVTAAISKVVQNIIQNSEQPPVIILQGDHGFVIPKRKFNILNAFFLPGDSTENMPYETISTVNTFRIIFNRYFDTNYSILRDKSIVADLGSPYKNQISPPFPTDCP